MANLDGQPSVVVGDRAGLVYAYHLNGGNSPAGWPYNAGAPVDSSPSVAPISPNGTDSVFIGSGNAGRTHDRRLPGHHQLRRRPVVRWGDQPEHRPGAAFGRFGLPRPSATTPAGTAWRRDRSGQNTYALGAGNGAILGGFPWFQADSVYSTAAVADLYADGDNELISGGDSTAGVGYGQTYSNGGHIRILSSAGNAGTATLPAA